MADEGVRIDHQIRFNDMHLRLVLDLLRLGGALHLARKRDDVAEVDLWELHLLLPFRRDGGFEGDKMEYGVPIPDTSDVHLLFGLRKVAELAAVSYGGRRPDLEYWRDSLRPLVRNRAEELHGDLRAVADLEALRKEIVGECPFVNLAGSFACRAWDLEVEALVAELRGGDHG